MLIFDRSCKLLTTIASCLIFIVLCILQGEANSQQRSQNQFQDWQTICDASVNGGKNCVLYQNLISKSRQELGISVAILKSENLKLMRVLAPLGVLLPSGLDFSVDGESLGKIQYIRCTPDGCSAETILSDAMLKKLKQGRQAQLVLYVKAIDGIGFPISLAGFSEGYEEILKE